MELVLARHGHSTANELRIISNRDLPHDLTELGRGQARQLGQVIADSRRPLSHVYSSPIPRAWQTAQIVAAGRPVVTRCDGLREIDCGVLEGRGDDDAWAIHDAVEDDWAKGLLDPHAEAGEPLRDVQARFEPCIRELVDRHHADEGTVLVVSHGTVLHQMLPRLLENLDGQWARRHPLGHCDTVQTRPEGRSMVCVTWAGVDPGECR